MNLSSSSWTKEAPTLGSFMLVKWFHLSVSLRYSKHLSEDVPVLSLSAPPQMMRRPLLFPNLIEKIRKKRIFKYELMLCGFILTTNIRMDFINLEAKQCLNMCRNSWFIRAPGKKWEDPVEMDKHQNETINEKLNSCVFICGFECESFPLSRCEGRIN